MLRLCHQMVTAHGHSCAEPRCDTEAREAAKSLSLPGAGEGFPHFLPCANTFTQKGPRTWVLVTQSGRQLPPGNSSRGMSLSPAQQEGATL